jgi:hypothetical protein
MKPLLEDFTESQLMNLGTYLTNELDSALLMLEHRNSEKFTFISSKYFDCVARSQYVILQRIVLLLTTKGIAVPRSFSLVLNNGHQFDPFNQPIENLKNA